MTYRIVSLDGGGIRGLLTSILLERIDGLQPGFLNEVDLIAGTSIGGILALSLAAGYSPADITRSYEASGTAVFANAPAAADKIPGQTAAHYDNANLIASLTLLFGDQTLGDLPQKVLIAAFDLDSEAESGLGRFRTWKPKFFHNFPGPGSDADEKIVDAALRTSAAPIYFPIYQGYVDGGVVVRNPAMCALAQAMAAGQSLDDAVMLSVGTGLNAHFLPDAETGDGDWGAAQWGRDMRLLDVTWGNDVSLVDFQCRQFLGQRYHRLYPLLSEAVHLDGLAHLRRLVEVARKEDLADTAVWLGKHFA